MKVCLTNCRENFFVQHDKPFSCIPKCSIDNPFFLVESLICVSHCTIEQRQNNQCVTYYIFSKEVNYQIFDEVINQTRNELTNDFNESFVTKGI